jgi:hypothetical protein
MSDSARAWALSRVSVAAEGGNAKPGVAAVYLYRSNFFISKVQSIMSKLVLIPKFYLGNIRIALPSFFFHHIPFR